MTNTKVFSELVEPDEDGHCKRCGLEFENPAELTHECPPGFRQPAVEKHIWRAGRFMSGPVGEG